MQAGVARRLGVKPDTIKGWVTQHRASMAAWAAFGVTALGVWHFLSDGDFSFLMTLSSLIGLMSFLMVVYKIEVFKSSAGVSLEMIQCYVVVFACRLAAIIPYEGYLPYDRSGDWLYQLVEGMSLCLAGSIAYMCKMRYKSTYDGTQDMIPAWGLAAGSGLLALLIHPSLNGHMITDIAWVWALYLECVAVLPQLYLFQRSGKVEPFTTHFLAGQALAKLFSFLFWLSSYSELNGPKTSINRWVGPWVLFLQITQLVLMGDFVYAYVRCMRKGLPMQYLLSENV